MKCGVGDPGGGLAAEDSAIPAPIPSSSLANGPSAREQLSQRRRRAARWSGGALALLLALAWLLLRADVAALPKALADGVGGWLTAAADAPRALVARMARDPGDASRMRAVVAEPRRDGARLAHAPTASRSPSLPVEPVAAAVQEAPRGVARTEATAPAPSAPPAESPAPAPAPGGSIGDEAAGPGAVVAAEIPPAPVTDLLGGLAPGDFSGALGTSVELGGGAAGVDTRLETGGAALDANVRVDAPAGGADLGASLGAGPAAAAVQLQVAPDQLGAGTALVPGGAGGAGVQAQASPGQLGTSVGLEVAGTPAALAVAAESEGIAIDVSTGGLVPALLGGNEVELEVDRLPVDLPLDLGLR